MITLVIWYAPPERADLLMCASNSLWPSAPARRAAAEGGRPCTLAASLESGPATAKRATAAALLYARSAPRKHQNQQTARAAGKGATRAETYKSQEDCSYTCAVWDQLVNWLNLHQLPASNSVSSIYRWWKKCRAMVAKDNKSFFDGLVIYFWWNIWKERNRRTFRQEEKTVTELTYLIKEDVQQFQHAIEVVN